MKLYLIKGAIIVTELAIMILTAIGDKLSDWEFYEQLEKDKRGKREI